MQLRKWISASKFSIVAALCSALAACGGGGGSSGGLPPGGGFGDPCNPGTDVQLANPGPLSSSVSTNIGAITIVANGNSNQLYSTYSSWEIVLQGSFGNINGGQLSLVPRNGNPQPFPSDFYYASSVPTLPAGQTFQVLLLNNNGSCGDVQIGTFST